MGDLRKTEVEKADAACCVRRKVVWGLASVLLAGLTMAVDVRVRKRGAERATERRDIIFTVVMAEGIVLEVVKNGYELGAACCRGKVL